jgi:hypothetical protein
LQIEIQVLKEEYMIRIKPSVLLACMTLVGISAGSLRAQERMRPGMWEVAMTSGGVAGMKNTRCYTRAEADNANGSEKELREREAANAKLKKSSCTVQNVTVKGDSVTLLQDCGKSSQTIRTTYRGDTFETVISSSTGETLMVIAARRLGSCP